MWILRRNRKGKFTTIDYLSKESKISEENRYELTRTSLIIMNRADKNGVIGAIGTSHLNIWLTRKKNPRINFILGPTLISVKGLDALKLMTITRNLDGNPP